MERNQSGPMRRHDARATDAAPGVNRPQESAGRLRLVNAMSVDVEDYYQVSAFEGVISRDQWAGIPSRIPRNVDKILEIFDGAGVHATFFVLGWVCKQHPGLVKRIADAGHEIASHGDDHARVGTMDREAFLADSESTRKLLEDTSGRRVIGYRAPSFSIGQGTLWAHDVLAEAGFEYSSSIFPVSHDHYGLPDSPRFPYRVADDRLLEIPMSTVRVFGRNWPCSGGGYFRLMPYRYSNWCTTRINRDERKPVVFYFHPWELDPGQPRVQGISAKARFRHYLNLDRFEARLRRMLADFSWDRMDKVFLGLS